MNEVVVPYAPNAVQRAIERLVQEHRFAIAAVHRAGGKSWGCAYLALDTALFGPPGSRVLYCGPYRNQVERNIWQTMKTFAAPIPGMIPNESDLTLTFPHNQSQIGLIGTDGQVHLLGSHSDLLILDEPADMDPDLWPRTLRPTLSARGGKAVFIGTFTTRQNWFFQLYEKAATIADWGRLLLRASESGILSPEELASARATMTEEQYLQQYELVPSTVSSGSIYGKLLDEMEQAGRLGAAPWNPALPVWTAWDIGVSDSTAIWFLQPYGLGWAAIDYEEHAGAGMSFYAKLVQEKPYTYRQHIGPHDLSVQEWGSGRTRLDVAAELGIDFDLAPRLSVEEGIDAVRRLLPQLWIDRSTCARGVEALENYHFTWDESLRMFSRRPFHNWASNGCDALRTFATSDHEMRREPPEPVKVETTFDPRRLFGSGPHLRY